MLFRSYTQHREVRKQNPQAFLGALGACAHWPQVDFAALRAMARYTFHMAAVMAAQLAMALVHGHARIAAFAFGHPAAVMAQQGRREAATVEKHQDLLAGGEGLADGLLHRPGNTAVQWPAFYIQA